METIPRKLPLDSRADGLDERGELGGDLVRGFSSAMYFGPMLAKRIGTYLERGVARPVRGTNSCEGHLAVPRSPTLDQSLNLGQ
eukprot:3630845-Pyramimonas_sp.AAC.1